MRLADGAPLTLAHRRERQVDQSLVGEQSVVGECRETAARARTTNGKATRVHSPRRSSAGVGLRATAAPHAYGGSGAGRCARRKGPALSRKTEALPLTMAS